MNEIELNTLVAAFADPDTLAIPPLRITMGIDDYFGIFPAELNDPAFPCGDTPCEQEVTCDYGRITLVVDDRDAGTLSLEFGDRVT